MTEFEEFELAYHKNSRIFARHIDLIERLKWNRKKYTEFVLHLVKSENWVLESGHPDPGIINNFPIYKFTGHRKQICYSIRKQTEPD